MPGSKVFHHTLFQYCHDVAQMRHFYTDLLALDETFYRDDDEAGWLSYQSGILQIVFTRVEADLPLVDDWSVQFSFEEGTLYQPSWAVEVPYDDFAPMLERIKADGTVPYLDENIRKPRVGQISFWVRDPMGVTIELYANTPAADE